jgi:hypothetical protein
VPPWAEPSGLSEHLSLYTSYHGRSGTAVTAWFVLSLPGALDDDDDYFDNRNGSRCRKRRLPWPQKADGPTPPKQCWAFELRHLSFNRYRYQPRRKP